MPVRLYDGLQAFRAQLERVASHLVFNTSAPCAEALEEVLKQACKELEQLQVEATPAAKPEGRSGQVAGTLCWERQRTNRECQSWQGNAQGEQQTFEG